MRPISIATCGIWPLWECIWPRITQRRADWEAAAPPTRDLVHAGPRLERSGVDYGPQPPAPEQVVVTFSPPAAGGRRSEPAAPARAARGESVGAPATSPRA